VSLAEVLELLEREDEAQPVRVEAAELAARKGLSAEAPRGPAALAAERPERTS
jgi:hypothetical protein